MGMNCSESAARMDENQEGLFQEKIARRARPPKKLRVLAIDDDRSILELLKTALSALDNFEVSIAASGVAALKIIDRETRPFDCLLVDIQMPEMNGIKLCKNIRARRDYRETPIIMLTAMSDRKYVDQAFLAGASDYVTKPFDFLELRGRMSAAQRMVQQRRKAKESIEVAKKLKAELDTKHHFSLDDPIAVGDVDRFLRYSEFDNYIMQLSHGRLFNSFATAFKVVNAREIFEDMPSKEFRNVVHDVATGIARITRESEDILCYRGSGNFLAVTHGRSAAQQVPSEESLNQFVETLQAQRRSTASPYVYVGDRVSLRSLSKSGALMTLNKAIQNVEEKSANWKEHADARGDARSNSGEIPDKSRKHRRAYQSVLRDLFKEEPSLRSH